MALATQCPHCHTTFKVAQDQLKLRSGLVRCGTCKQVFNGIEHLVSPDAPVPTSAPLPSRTVTPAASTPSAIPTAPAVAPPSAPTIPKTEPATKPQVDFVSLDEPLLGFKNTAATAPLPAQPVIGKPGDTTVASAKAPASPPSPVASTPPTTSAAAAAPEAPAILPETTTVQPAVPKTEAAPQPAPESVTKPESVEEPEVEASIAVNSPDIRQPVFPLPAKKDVQEPAPKPIQASPEPKPAPEPEPETGSELEPETITNTEELSLAEAETEPEAEENLADDEIDEPDFVIRSRRRQRRSRILRTFMACTSVVLLIVLALQGAFAFRNQLAAWFPQSKPMLAQMCAIAGCQVKLPAQIEMVTIESNELLALAADKHTFTLTLLLRNHSTVTQAWPYIELTLNDANENALARRVLLPRDYLPPTQDGNKGFAANSEQPVKLNFELPQIKASGYRVYLFYP